MKKMKTRTKLAGAVTALVVAVACSAGTTFAWFTVSRTVSVTNISAEVTSNSSGLEIANGLNQEENFGSLIVADIDASTALDAVSTVISNNVVSMVNRTYIATNNTESSKADDVSYITIDLTLRAKDELYINLGAGSDVTSKAAASPYTVLAWDDGAGNTAVTASKYGIEKDIDVNGTIGAEAANASRVSFEISDYDTTHGDTYNTSYVSSSTPTKVWSPHEASITGAHVADSTALSALGSYANSKKAGFYMGNLASDYEQHLLAKGLMTCTELDTATGYNSTHWQNTDADDNYYYTGAAYTQSDIGATGSGYTDCLVPISSNSAEAKEDNTDIVKLSTKNGEYYYANLTVKIWLEGTDGDCLNSIFSQTLNVALELVGTVS